MKATPDAGVPRIGVTAQAVVLGMAVMLAGTVPRNLLFAANLKFYAAFPWAVPLVAIYLFVFWRYLGGAGPPATTAAFRREALRARRIGLRAWIWSLAAGLLGIVALVAALHVANRLVVLPAQALPDLSAVPPSTVLALLIAAAPVAGVVEEAAFRGYMQGPLERAWGVWTAILVAGTMFAVAHLDFTPLLWPYYVAVAAIYGGVTFLTRSILPAVVLHTAGNLWSNLDLWLHGRAEWQTGAQGQELIGTGGADARFWIDALFCLGALLAALWAFHRLARVCGAAQAASSASDRIAGTAQR